MSKSSESGYGLTGILQIIFIVLKLTNNIQWSWLWVFSPIWISAAFVGFVLAFVGLGTIGAAIGQKARLRREYDELRKGGKP